MKNTYLPQAWIRFARVLSCCIACQFFSSVLLAAEQRINRTVTLQSADTGSIDIASIELIKQGDGTYHYTLEMDDSKFSNHFLSMRPFKCFQGSRQMMCYLPYPYQKTHRLSQDDLQDLEYDLLFIWRKSSDYGIDPWNGIYYKLTLDKEANLTGVLHEVDLNILAAPPEQGVTRPITDRELNAAEAASHSYPELVIK